LMWPTFASVEGFRKFHGTHHQFTNLPGDGNRHIWYTHDAMGELEPGWVFPKTRLGLALVLLRRAFFFTGMYWLVPFCTWQILVQYVRIICEHSAVESDEEEYSITRTTIPTWLESIFILPRNVGYHLEHHWYPSVPFY